MYNVISKKLGFELITVEESEQKSLRHRYLCMVRKLRISQEEMNMNLREVHIRLESSHGKDSYQ